MSEFQYGQWYQRGGEIFYIYDIDNFQERVWLAPAVHPKPYDASMSDFDIVQYEYFKDNEDLLAEKWGNYTNFKKELYNL